MLVSLHESGIRITIFATFCSIKFITNTFEIRDAWKPTYSPGKYFERYNKLYPKYEFNNWETIRIPNMIPRSYQKSKDLPYKIDMRCQDKNLRLFDDRKKENKNKYNLGKSGKNIINKFIQQNINKENLLRKNEMDYENYKHSKHEPFINPWYPFNHIIGEFSIYKDDENYYKNSLKNKRTSYSNSLNRNLSEYYETVQKKKKNYNNEEPFYPPRKIGDYFYERPSKAINHY